MTNCIEDFGLVSIVTPCFNCEKTILDTFFSIASQSYKNWEWVVIDDCSTDNTLQILSELKSKGHNIIIIRETKNSGAAKCRNDGIRIAKGRYIAFLDSDDIWHRNKLLLQCKFMFENQYIFTYTDYAVFDNKSHFFYQSKAEKLNYKQLLKHCDIGCLTAMYDSKYLGKIYMPEKANKREDYATWLAITKTGVLANKLPIVLAKYRLSPGSVSSKKFSLIKYHWNVYRKIEKFSFWKSLFYILIFIYNKVLFKY